MHLVGQRRGRERCRKFVASQVFGWTARVRRIVQAVGASRPSSAVLFPVAQGREWKSLVTTAFSYRVLHRPGITRCHTLVRVLPSSYAPP